MWQAQQTGAIDQLTKARCEHVVAENGRTEAAAAILRDGDAVAFGRLMDQSHMDLRDKFEVCCPELDTMVALARSLPGCLGSRMTGAGFGGCTVSLVRIGTWHDFAEHLLAAYGEHFDLKAAVYVTCAAAAGAGTWTSND